ncbi:MAG: hypothetical protein GC131_07710 [Alphaproteobacteria bacterium]|nr:hypothetical protein [Alphaproteobacteria bacterium]
MKRIALLILAAALVFPMHAFARTAADEISMADARAVAVRDLDGLRGGFGAGNLIYRFAVNVHAMFNGSSLFERSVVMENNNGSLETTVNTSSLNTQSLPSNLQAALVGNNAGVVVTHEDGTSTTFLNETANGTPSSIINNTASGIDASQTVNIDLTLQNMQQVISDIDLAKQNTAISNIAESVNMQPLGYGF